MRGNHECSNLTMITSTVMIAFSPQLIVLHSHESFQNVQRYFFGTSGRMNSSGKNAVYNCTQVLLEYLILYQWTSSQNIGLYCRFLGLFCSSIPWSHSSANPIHFFLFIFLMRKDICVHNAHTCQYHRPPFFYVFTVLTFFLIMYVMFHQFIQECL